MHYISHAAWLAFTADPASANCDAPATKKSVALPWIACYAARTPRMPPISAADSISPAFARTRLVLFSPFIKGRTWKLSATAYAAATGNLFVPFPLAYLFFLPAVSGFGHAAMAALLIACSSLSLVFLFLFVLCSRLQFVFFDVVLNREQFVAPLWRKHRSVYAGLTWLRVAAGLVLVLALAAPIAGYSRQLFAAFGSLSSLKPGQMPPPEFFLIFYGGFFAIYAVIATGFFLGSLAFDFIVPSLALEGAKLPAAFRRLGALVRAEPGQFALYCLLKLVLGFAGYMGLAFSFQIVLLLAVAIVGLLALLCGFLLHLAGVATGVLIALGIALGVLLYIFLFFYVMLIGIGTLITFLEAYSLYFLSGRYPLLAEHLARSTPPQAPALPQPWSPALYTPPPA